ncbi:acyltransferase family protein [Spirosoma koreense]
MKPGTYLSSLTSLRGIAALLVIFLHIDGIAFPLLPPQIPFFIRKGYLWVDFFFMLSGFIMVHVYGTTFSRDIRWPAFRRFMWARFARIYPLHLVSFLCMLGFYAWYQSSHTLTPFDHVLYDLGTIPSQLLLLQGMGVNRFLSWNAPSWSISTEWWMYTLFPWLLRLFRHPARWKSLVILLVILAGYLFILYYLRPVSTAASPYPDPTKRHSLDVTYDYGFIRCLLGFLLGMLLHQLYATNWGYPLLNRSVLVGLVSLLILLTLSLPLPDIIPVSLMALLVLLSAYNRGLANRVLTLKPLLFLGDISYSLYLMHLPLLYGMLVYAQRFASFRQPHGWMGVWAYSLGFVGLMLLVATLTYRLVELPARRKLNQLIGQHIHSEKKLLS